MSRLVLVRSLVLVLLSLVVLGGCGGSGGVDSEHDLVPTQETNVTDTNTTPDTNGTQPDTNGTGGNDNNGTAGGSTDTNSTTGGGSDDGNATGGGDDTNTTDVTPPVITLNGEANMTLEQNATYTEPGAVAVDAVDGNVPVSISGNVDTSTVGHYVVTYSATDHAGNQAHATRHIKIINSAPTLTSLGLESNTTTLNKDHNTTLTLTATYSDHTTKPLTSGITWIITPQEAVTLHGTTLTALKDTNVTVQAKVGTTLSNAVSLNIYWEVNGHRLPPEPDPAVNNSTLLGVDVNGNGVRDDVERWIYETYKHPIERAAFMQLAKALQYRMGHADEAWEYRQPTSDAVTCFSYWNIVVKYIGLEEYQMKQHAKNIELTDEIDFIQYNTEIRKADDEAYQKALSGGIIKDNGLEPEEWIQKCDFNATKLMKDQQ